MHAHGGIGRRDFEAPSGQLAGWAGGGELDLGATRGLDAAYCGETPQVCPGTIPQVTALLAKVKGKHGGNHPELAKIEEEFFGVAQEMYAHMQKEEQILFPYIERLERAEEGKEEIEPPFFQTVRNPVHMMMQEHDSAGEALKTMRKLSSGYHAPTDACESYREAYRSLEEFEADMHTHVHLENNILFPRAVQLEAKIL